MGMTDPDGVINSVGKEIPFKMRESRIKHEINTWVYTENLRIKCGIKSKINIPMYRRKKESEFGSKEDYNKKNKDILDAFKKFYNSSKKKGKELLGNGKKKVYPQKKNENNQLKILKIAKYMGKHNQRNGKPILMS